ncbi:MAG: hypothetical protein J6573_00230 [Lactobacillus sp.]|nr:hypothetical protein [Lactobacillus sp.]
MQEGIYFPKFWQRAQIEHWIDHFINSKLATPIVYQFDFANEQVFLPVDWLRQLYTSQYAEFREIVNLFNLFGIKVHTSHNLGLFSVDDRGNSFVIDTQVINIRQLVDQHPLLDFLQFFVPLLTYDSLYGLVLDQLNILNPAIKINDIVQLFSDCQINVKTPIEIVFKKSLSSHPERHKIIENNKPKLEHSWTEQQLNKYDKGTNTELISSIFYKKSYRSFVRALNAKGIFRIDQLTHKIIEQVVTNLNFSKKKLKKIDSILEQLPQNNNCNESTLQVSKAKVNQALLANHRTHISTNIKKVFLPMLPFPSNILNKSETIENKVIISLSEYKEKVRTYIDKDHEQQYHYPAIDVLTTNLTSLTDKDWQQSKVPPLDILKYAIEIEWGQSTYTDQQIVENLPYTWYIQHQLLPNSIESYLHIFWQSMSEDAQNVFRNRFMSANDSVIYQDSLTNANYLRNLEREWTERFKIWWQQMSFTNKLLITSGCQQCKLKDYFSPGYDLLIYNTIVQYSENEMIKKLWTI